MVLASSPGMRIANMYQQSVISYKTGKQIPPLTGSPEKSAENFHAKIRSLLLYHQIDNVNCRHYF
jgi:hypothetical protein